MYRKRQLNPAAAAMAGRWGLIDAYIESIEHWKKFVISSDFDGDLSFIEMSCILPDPQLSILDSLFQILFVYPLVLGAVKCEDR